MKNIEKFKVLLEGKDQNGDIMTFDIDTGVVTLILEGRPTVIGLIKEEYDGRYTYIKQEEEQHFMRAINGWSINAKILKHVDLIIYNTELAEYRINKTDAYNHSVPFKTSDGFDRKVFVPISYWHIGFKDPLLNFMSFKMGTDWVRVMHKELLKPYWMELGRKIEILRRKTVVYPEQEDTFNALKYTPFDDVKVVIIGQDPYHNGTAHGLAFSSPKKITPSLTNIFKEIELEYPGELLLDKDPDLTRWTSQGVLLLNTILTVEEGKPLSHIDLGWQRFTTEVIRELSLRKKRIVYMLWGKYAQEFKKVINSTHNLILEAPHPSPYSASSGFFGCGHFKKANEYMINNRIKPISW